MRLLPRAWSPNRKLRRCDTHSPDHRHSEKRSKVELPSVRGTAPEPSTIQEQTSEDVAEPVTEPAESEITQTSSDVAQLMILEVANESTQTASASDDTVEVAPIRSEVASVAHEKTTDVMKSSACPVSDKTTVNKREAEELDQALPDVSAKKASSEERPDFEAIHVRTPQSVPQTRSGKTELESGELSEATVLFQRVYYGAKRAPMHGKVTETTESMNEVFTEMYGAVH